MAQMIRDREPTSHAPARASMLQHQEYRSISVVPAPRRIDRSNRSLIASFGYAFSGLWYLLRTQRNAQIHVLIGSCAVALGGFLHLERWEWLALVLMIVVVLAAEGANTAVEAAVDVATEQFHPLARIAKDVAAGTVLICAMAAVIVGCVIFIPHLWPLIVGLYGSL